MKEKRRQSFVVPIRYVFSFLSGVGLLTFALFLFPACSQSGGFLERIDGASIVVDDFLDGATNTSTIPEEPGADAGPPEPNAPPDPLMSFFVTSRRVEVSGQPVTGGNFGGISGADAFCLQLAKESLPDDSKTWRAYLSTSGENARDRIGAGPWRNYDGTIIADNVDDLHANPPPFAQMVTETGSDALFPSLGHAIVTGSNGDGRAFRDLNELLPYFIFPDFSFEYSNKVFDFNCRNWTTDGNATGNGQDAADYAVIGHVDWNNLRDGLDPRGYQWNSAHATACDARIMKTDTSDIRLYCFASN